MSLVELAGQLRNKFEVTDIDKVKQDVAPFIQNQDELKIWSNEYFIALSERIVFL